MLKRILSMFTASAAWNKKQKPTTSKFKPAPNKWKLLSSEGSLGISHHTEGNFHGVSGTIRYLHSDVQSSLAFDEERGFTHD